MQIFPKNRKQNNGIKCPGCGATMDVDYTAGHAVCPYCRTIVPVSTQPDNVKSVLNFVDKRLDRMAAEKREQELRREKTRRQSLIGSVVGLVIVGILLSIMISKEKQEKEAVQVQSTTVASETNIPATSKSISGQAEPKATETEKIPPSQKLSSSKLLESEGGVSAYRNSGGNVYLVIDSNNNTLTRIDPQDVHVYHYSGNIFQGVEVKDHRYKLSSDLKELSVKYLSGGIKEKTLKYPRVPLESAESYAQTINNWYENYNQRFKGHLAAFGNYEQNNNTTNGLEPITWIVLKEDAGKTLLLSSFVLEFHSYNSISSDSVGCTWKTSTIRNWLNEEFYSKAFSADEKEQIISTTIEADGQTTSDNVFFSVTSR